MKTVERKAKEYSEPIIYSYSDCRWCDAGELEEYIQDAYIAGYTEANKWISVEDELPPFEDVPINERTKYLIKVSTGSISPKIDVRIGCLSNHRKWIGEMDWVTVTHWRPIN